MGAAWNHCIAVSFALPCKIHSSKNGLQQQCHYGEDFRNEAFDGDTKVGELLYANDGTPPTVNVAVSKMFSVPALMAASTSATFSAVPAAQLGPSVEILFAPVA